MSDLWKYRATPEYRYFLHDPEGEGTIFFRDKAERDKCAEASIQSMLGDDGWHEAVEFISVGEVTGISACPDPEYRPEITDDMDDEEVEEIRAEWGDHDWRGNYRMVSVAEPPKC